MSMDKMNSRDLWRCTGLSLARSLVLTAPGRHGTPPEKKEIKSKMDKELDENSLLYTCLPRHAECLVNFQRGREGGYR